MNFEGTVISMLTIGSRMHGLALANASLNAFEPASSNEAGPESTSCYDPSYTSTSTSTTG